MGWAYTFSLKAKITLALITAFVFIFINDWLEKRSVSELGTSFSSVYEDRLLAESYIYKLSDHLFRKKMMIDDNSTASKLSQLRTEVDKYNLAMDQIIHDYEKTKLTAEEQNLFESLKGNLNVIESKESGYLEAISHGKLTEADKALFEKQYTSALENLQQLSGIQVSEGKALNDRSQRIMSGYAVSTYLETGLLLGIAVLVQALILAKKSVLSRISQKPSLN
ncbi:MCP four helix bundle domain-containing protein [Sabulibacter ruber]|uniref:MCP four helix bundle domain-containing protein n=1 Tax=Sabulibacter ruber TaxID=2811901 RepID=UPI001A97AD70|nr:MCP four helix bundle domain-containing protein [Sabulibacter ruber]